VDHSNYSLVNRAKTIRSFRLVDLDGDGVDEILVEADRTGVVYAGESTHIFTTYGSQLVQLAEVETLRLEPIHLKEIWLAREIDVDKTRQAGGKMLYFKTTVYGTETARYRTPRIEEFVVKPRPQRPD
jgi:hypothetical protein